MLAQHNSHTQPFSSQQFGAQAGGSFLKRWYWFGDYEGTRIDNANPIFERVPSSYDRSHLDLFQPGTSGYQDAQFAQSVLSLYPKSNIVAIPDVLEFYQGYAPNYTNVDNYLGGVDFTQSDRTEWTFRYNLQDLSQLHDDTLPNSSNYPGNGAQRAVLNQNLVVTFTHRFSDQFSNVLPWRFHKISGHGDAPGRQLQCCKRWIAERAHADLSALRARPAVRRRQSVGRMAHWEGGKTQSGPHPSLTTPVITPSLDGLFPFARIGAPLSAPAERQRHPRRVRGQHRLVQGEAHCTCWI